MKRYTRQKTDANQTEIVEDIRRQGAKVEILGDPLDLLAWLPSSGKFGLIEVKIDGSKAVYTREQLMWIANTGLPVVIVKTSHQAMRFLETGEGVTQKQKDSLAAFLFRDKAKRFTPKIIEGVLGK
jgi:hypothetical protein